MAERPLQYGDHDEVALAKERNFGVVNAEDPTTRLQDDLESEKNTSEMGVPVDDHWEAPSTDDDVGERVGPGEESSHHGKHSPVPSVISMKSDQSMDTPTTFTGGHKDTRIDVDKPDSLSSRSSASELSEDSTHVAYSQHTTEPGGVLCAVCPKRAYKSCLTCMASFCEIHVQQHYSAPALQRHRLVDATEDLQQRMCSRHNRELELYCRTDQTAICVLCMAVEHTGHDITELGEHQQMQPNQSEMEKKTAVPPPGPIEFTSVKPDSVCVCWGPPERLTGPHRFRVSWTGEGSQENLEVQDLKLHVQELTPGEKYTFTVATLRDDGKQSPCVSSTVQTAIPPPECLTVDMNLTSVSVTWSKPAGVDQASYLLALCSDGKCLQTTSTKSLHHCFPELDMEKRYTISVSTVLNKGQSKPISEDIRTSIPVPEKLTVSSVTPTSADLSWSLHQGMEQIPHSFLISYHSEGTEPQTISTESCSTTLTDLQPDTQYTVTVCCELIEGGRSQATSTVMHIAVPPPGPIDFTSVKPDSVCVCWGPSVGLTGPHRFRVSWTGEGNKGHVEVQDLKLHVQELTPGEKYTFTVATLSDDDRQSPCVSATVHTDIPSPECLTMKTDVTSVTATWSKPAGVDQVSYSLTLCCDGEDLQTVSTKSLHHQFSGLKVGREYSITVSTVLKGGQSKCTSKAITTSVPVPENLAVSSETLISADLSWSLHAVMKQIPHSFLISYHSEGTKPQTVSVESCSTTLTDLQPDTQYTVSVCCELRDGRRSQDTTTHIQTAVPSPGPIEFTSVKPDSVCVCWGPPEGLTGPHRFRVSWTGEGSQEHLEVQDLKLHVQELTPGEKYTFTVATLRDDGRQSPCVSATQETGIPVPENLTVSSVTLTSADLSWSLHQWMEQIPHSFLIYHSEGTKPQTVSVETCSTTLTGLQPDTQYTVNVCCKLRDGGRSQATTAHIRTGVPVPENLAVSSETPTSADLSWSLHEEMKQIPHSFLISYHSLGTEPQTISTKSRSTTLTGLQPGTQYTVSVCCELIEGGRSQATSTVMHIGIPAPESLRVDKLDVENDDGWRADLRWSVGQGMEQIPHSFLISYPISTDSCSTTRTDLQPDTQSTVSASSTDLSDTQSTVSASLTDLNHAGSIPAPESLNVDKLDVENDVRWRADLSWSVGQGMEQIPHSFLISYHISTESCSTTRTDLQPDTQSTVSASLTDLNHAGSIPVPESLNVDKLDVKSDQGMKQNPHSEGTKPNTYSTTIRGLQPDTQYSVSVWTVLQSKEQMKSKSEVTTFHTSERRIVLLGKTGDGKSSAGNTILEEKEVFKSKASQHPNTCQCKTHSRIINGRKITVIDTPGFFDTTVPKASLKRDIAKCIFDSSPGPHALIIVLRVGRYTEHEEQIAKQIKKIFADDTFKYAVVLFTYGNELKGRDIKDYVEEERTSQGTGSKITTLKDLVDACYGRCHVIDNAYWNNQKEGLSRNRTQLAELFKTIEEMVQKNGGYYTNEFLMLVEEAIQEKMQFERDRQEQKQQNQDQSETIEKDIREIAKEKVRKRMLLNKIVSTPAVMLFALFSLPLIPAVEVRKLINSAAAKAKNPGEAVIEALEQLRLSLQTRKLNMK